MSNSYYNNTASFLPGTTADGVAVDDKFDAVEAGFDLLEVDLDEFNAGYETKSVGFTAVNQHRYFCDTSGGAFTATLPATPVAGNTIYFADGGSSFSTNNLTIGKNGSTIMGTDENLVVDVDNMAFGLSFDGATWRLV